MLVRQVQGVTSLLTMLAACQLILRCALRYDCHAVTSTYKSCRVDGLVWHFAVPMPNTYIQDFGQLVHALTSMSCEGLSRSESDLFTASRRKPWAA